jgi:hypothetical protein
MMGPISNETIKLIASIAMTDENFASKIDPDNLDEVMYRAMKIYIIEKDTIMEEKIAAFIKEKKIKNEH